MSRSIILMTATVLALSFGAAHAAEKSMVVTAKDLNLSSPKDVKRLYDRIATAAQAVCGGGPLVTFGPFPNTDFIACRDSVIDTALSQFQAPLVVALRKPKPNEQLAAAAPSDAIKP
jgi:UrcA family protein